MHLYIVTPDISIISRRGIRKFFCLQLDLTARLFKHLNTTIDTKKHLEQGEKIAQRFLLLNRLDLYLKISLYMSVFYKLPYWCCT